MAKKETAEDKAMRRLEAEKEKTAAAQRALATTQGAMGKQKKEMTAAKREVAKVAASEEQMLALVKPQGSRLRRAAIDGGSTASAQALTELINLAWRALAESRKASLQKEGKDPRESFFYGNVDVLQSTSGAVGSAIWLVELLTRPSVATDAKGSVLTDSKGQPLPFVAGWGREYAHDLGLILQNLGLHNLFRSLRFRWREDIDEEAIKQDAIDAASAEIAELRRQLEGREGRK